MSKLKVSSLFPKNLGRVFAIAIFIIYAVSFAASQSNRQLERDKSANTNTESRTALVIGNGGYADSPLKNPTNDATDMAAALKNLGFEVLAYTNLDQNGMKKAIRDFGAKLRTKGGVGLFYYAGHGVQVKGVNYLIPVSATVNTEEEVEYESVEVGLVLAQMEAAKNNMNIVILDACRNNPFARSFRSADKGLASIDAPSGTLLAYSTAPGSVASDGNGRNGLYTQELLKAMQSDGLSIEDIFKRVRVSVRSATADKQTPWESSSLTGNFYFTNSTSTKIINTQSDKTSANDEIIWNAIKNSKTRTDFVEFVRAFPSSKYVPQAQKRIKELENQPADSNNSNVSSQINNSSKSTNKIVGFNLLRLPTPADAILIMGIVGMKGSDDVQIFINNLDVSKNITEQNGTTLKVAGKYESLNLKLGKNEIYVIVNGIKTDVYIYKQF